VPVDDVMSWDGWDEVADVVIVGSGAAAASAAVTAAANGASVIVLEKAPFTGGTTAKSGGVFWVPNNPWLASQGIDDPKPDAMRYMAKSAYPVDYDPDSPTLGLTQHRYDLIEAFYDKGGEALASIAAAGGIDIEYVHMPSYYSQWPEDVVGYGRVLQPKFPEGWRRGEGPTGGQLLVDGLLDAARAHGAKVLVDHEVVHVVRDDDGGVLGLEVRTGKRALVIGARQGVVFGSGGFLHDPQLATAYLRGPVFGGAASDTATGDFVRMGIEVGAQLGNMGNAWWDQCVVELALRNRATSHDIYSPYGDAMVMVNKYGRRAVNEKAPYNERGQAHLTWDPSRLEYPNLLMFMIVDDSVLPAPKAARFRWPFPAADEEQPFFLISAPDLHGLAAEIDRRLESISSRTGGARLSPDFVQRLGATVDEFNRYAAAGHDPDFLRGSSPIEQNWAGEPKGDNPNPAMRPLSTTGPYHCIILGPGALDTKGGPVTNARAEVVNVDGDPIPGLFAAGNCTASPAGQAYWGPGGTIGPAIAFGHIAALSAVARPRR
jgi:3-oxosteroid 1-dehydrogenase